MTNRDADGNVKPDFLTRMKNLVAKIPGLDDFMNREKLRENDKLLREYTAKQLDAAKTGLDNLKKALLDDMKISWLDDVDRMSSKIDRLRDKHRFDAYGYSGAFDANKILEPELQKLYDYDLTLLDKVERFKATCAKIGQEKTDDQSLKMAMDSLQVEIAALAELVDNRGEALNKLVR